MSGKEDLLQPGFVERRRHPRVSNAPLGIDKERKGVLVPLQFGTAELPKSQQFPAWQEHMAPVLDCRLPDGADIQNGFIVQQTVWNLGGMLVVQETVPAYGYERSPQKIRFSPIDHWRIAFLRSGRTWTEVDGHVAQNEPGMMEVRSLGRPFRGRSLAVTTISLVIPVDLFFDQGGLPPASNNAVIGGHRVSLLLDYLSSVEANLERFTHDDLAVVKVRLQEMVFDAVTALVDRTESKDQLSQVGLMTRARRFIQNNISSPVLNIDSLCKELAISRTRLYELFEVTGGVANYIRRRRLLTAHAMLADPTGSQKIADIGLAIGIESSANFSRTFTQYFGYSPSSVYRKNSIVDQIPPAERGIIKDYHQHTFEGLLRTLGLF
ncbi:helix-turn-helix transcriptional regulator [Ochrobactrum sp. LMG 5442]|nr:helix-turn-helix transcriptional regulator [Ochrobactrum sp. LMG 5442]